MRSEVSLGAKPRDLMRALRRAGFYEDRAGGGHRIWKHPCGAQAVVTLSRSNATRTWRNMVLHVRRAIAQVPEN